MSDQNTHDTPTTPVEAPQSDADVDQVESPNETPNASQEPSEADESKPGNSEAAKWRVKFREAESTIASLTDRVVTMQAAEVSRLATGPGLLHDGGDLLLAARLEDLLDDDGNIDPEKVTEQVSALAGRKPHLAKPAFGEGIGAGAKGGSGEISWADVISG